MRLTSLIFATALGVAGFAGAATAATTNSTSTTPNTASSNTTANGQNSAAHINLRQDLKSDLSKAGFTDVKVMPESFLVQAKDSKGHQVMMVINPDSFTEVTAMSTNASNNGQSNAKSAQATTNDQSSTKK